MLRLFRPTLVATALLFSIACGSSHPHDNDNQNHDDDQNGSNLAAQTLAVTTAEDTPISGTVVVTGAVGAVVVTVQQAPTHGDVTITGTQITYTPDANFAGTDSGIVTVSDSTTSVSASVTITVTAVDDPPAVVGAPELTVAEDGFITLSTTNVPLTDIDSAAGDLTLTVATSSSYINNGNEVHPLPDFNGNLVVHVTLSDGTSTAQADVTVAVTAVNDAPEITVPSSQVTANGVSFTYDSAHRISIADVDAGSSPIDVDLTTTGGGVLTLSTTEGLTALTGDGTNAIHFSGTLSAANTALNGLVLNPQGVSDGLITVSVTANDQGATGAGGALSDTETTTVAVGAADQPPQNTVPASASGNEDAAIVFTGPSRVSVLDPDVGDVTVSVQLGVTHGTLTLSGTTGLTVTGNGTNNVTLSGTFVNVNAALLGMTYAQPANSAVADSFGITSNSGGLTDTDNFGISMTAVNDGPDITGPTSAIGVPQDTIISFTGGNAIAVSDIDAGTSPVKLTADANHGDFAFTTATASTLTASVGHVQLVGTLTQINADLALLTWNPQGYVGGTSLSFVINDQGATGSGGAHTRTLNFTINEAASFSAQDDHYKAQGNVPRTIAAPGVLANDAGTGLHVTTTTTTSTLGGTVTMQADGSFTYVPPRGQGAREQDGGLNDTFTYAIQDSDTNTANGVVTINIRRVIWFVDKDHAGGSQDGTFTAPYDTIDEAVAAAAAPPAGSHFGTWIYVYNSASPYVLDVSPATGVSLFGSLNDFDLQDADPDDPTDPFEPTTLPGIGAPELRPTTTTAVHLTANSKLSGFRIRTNGNQTGPAVEGLPLFSGVIDNLDIDDFQTAIALANLGADTVQIDSVTITDASTTAISLSANNASGLIITQSELQRVGHGIDVQGTAGPDDNGRIFLFVAATNILDASNAIVVQTEQGTEATEPSSIRIASGDIVNGPSTLGVLAIHVVATGGDVELRVTDVDVDRYLQAFVLTTLAADVNALLATFHLLGTYAENPARLDGGSGGRVDLTVSDMTLNADQATGFVITGSATEVCLDMTNSNLAGVDPLNGLSLRQSTAAFLLEGYNGTDDIPTYFHTVPSGGQARDAGPVGTQGAFSGGTCAEPPID